MTFLLGCFLYLLAFVVCYGLGILLMHFVDWVWNTWSDFVLRRLEEKEE